VANPRIKDGLWTELNWLHVSDTTDCLSLLIKAKRILWDKNTDTAVTQYYEITVNKRKTKLNWYVNRTLHHAYHHRTFGLELTELIAPSVDRSNSKEIKCRVSVSQGSKTVRAVIDFKQHNSHLMKWLLRQRPTRQYRSFWRRSSQLITWLVQKSNFSTNH